MNDLRKIEEIYHAARELDVAARREFLDRECAGDETIRREVESLLSFDVLAAEFIEEPPGDVAADVFAAGRYGDLSGRALGRYEIVGRLGSGGMGDVYEAEDAKLRRRLALKVLPAQFAGDAERRRRFEQEARAASALNHPNIITIYGTEREDGVDFIVTELIEGETLKRRIARGPISPGEAVGIAAQIADALAAAASVGVVHRDIKPANVMIRPDGLVKVLDFGLAKFDRAASGSSDQSRDLTGAGRVLGTISYMSPEQALGEPIDGRSDVFSLGVTLFEMLAGAPPFAGATDAAVYDAIINKEAPPLDAAPPWLDSVVRKALAKKPAERFQSAAEFREALRDATTAAVAGTATPAPRRAFRRRLIFAAVVAGLIAAGALAVTYLRTRGRPDGLDPRRIGYSQFTSQAGPELYPSLSPDGRTIVYSALVNGVWSIYARPLEGGDAVNLSGASKFNDRCPVFSPDGSRIAFESTRNSDGGIYVMNADGSGLREVVRNGFFPSWSPDGREIVISNSDFLQPLDRPSYSELSAVDVETGARRPILTGRDGIQGAWSPHGQRIAFWSNGKGGQRDVYTVAADGSGEVVEVTLDDAVDWNPVWSPDGNYLYFASNRGGGMNLWRVPIDEASGRLLGALEPVTTPTTYFQHLAFSRDGKTFAFVESTPTQNLSVFDFDPQTETLASVPRQLTDGRKNLQNPAYSPDGNWIAYDAVTNMKEDIWIMRADGSDVRQLTNDPAKDRAPQWAPDGKSVAFFSTRSGKFEAWSVNADGTDLHQLTTTQEDQMMVAWSRDGRLFSNDYEGYPTIYESDGRVLRPNPVRLPPLPEPVGWIMAESWSPDGTKLAAMVINREDTVHGNVVYDLRTQKYDTISDFGMDAFWLSDSRRLMFLDGGKIFLVDSVTKRTKELLSVEPNKISLISIAPGDKAVCAGIKRLEADIWIGKEN